MTLSRFAVRRCATLAVLAVGLFGACDSPVHPSPTASPNDALPYVISNSRSSAAAAPAMVYVSLPPGTVEGGIDAVITVLGSGAEITTPVVDGGFDPVALAAVVGDTIDITTRKQPTEPPVNRRIKVPPSAPPVIVRTDPPPNRRDIPLNGNLVVVFSEPLDPSVLTNGRVRLRKGSVAVAGQVTFADAQHTRVQFAPSLPLEPATDYELAIVEGVRDLDGDALAAPMVVAFTTAGSGTTLGNAPFIVSHPVPSQIPFGHPPLSAWVSLPPGSMADGVTAYVWSASSSATGNSNVGFFANGGFDPVEIGAVAGEAIHVTINRANGAAPLNLTLTTPVASSPQLIRTDPTQLQQGLLLNASITVVFSEPIDRSSLAAIQLWAGGTFVASTGTVGRFRGAPIAQIAPSASLLAGTDYDLRVTQDVRSVTGSTMVTPVTVRFTTASPPAGAPLPQLTVEAFSIVEFRYSATATDWYYAPVMRIVESGGATGVLVTRIAVSIPGLLNPRPICSFGFPIAAGRTEDPLPELYGDYPISYFRSDGARLQPGQASVTVSYIDDWGRAGTYTAFGPIVAGSLPTTYSGGFGFWTTLECPR